MHLNMNYFYENVCFKIIVSSVIHTCFIGDAAAMNLTISSPSSNFDTNIAGRAIAGPVLCKSEVGLTHCQFRVDSGNIFDLRMGNITKRTVDITYHGQGLENGECGAKLSGELFSTGGGHVIECRVSNDDCEWKYASIVLFSTASKEIPVAVDTSARELVVASGSPATILFQLDRGQPLSECSVKMEHGSEWTMLGQPVPTPAEFNYYGGLRQGKCGITIHNVKPRMNGLVWFKFKVELNNITHEGMDFVRLIIARAPEVPIMEASVTTTPNGHVLHSSCSVTGSRPAATIRWYFGGAEIQPSNYNKITCVLENDWTWPHANQTTKQLLTIHLESNTVKRLGGKLLWCSAVNDVLNDTRSSKRVQIKSLIKELNMPEDKDLGTWNQETKWGVTNTLLVIVATLLCLIIICGCVSCLVYSRRNAVGFFSQPLTDEVSLASVNPRQMPIPNIIIEEDHSSRNQRGQQPILVSSLDDLYMATTNEYAEIRQSMIDSCKDEFGQTEGKTPESDYFQGVKFNSIYQE